MSTLCYEKVWIDKAKYDDAETLYFERKAKAPLTPLADEVAKARQRLIEIKRGTFDQPCVGLTNVVHSGDEAIAFLKDQQQTFEKHFKDIQGQLDKLSSRIGMLEKHIQNPSGLKPAPAPAPARKPAAEDDDDDGVDLFASESEEEENEAAAKIREERLAAYNAKKSKKPALIAKSSIVMDVKPWDDETDMKALEGEVRKISMPGLLWGAGKLVPLAYGIHKLQISCVVEDELVSVDALQEQIQEIEDYVQSVDIAAFNKI